MKLNFKLSLIVLSLVSSFCVASERSAWEEVYAKSQHKQTETALKLLQDRYHSLPEGAEKLYLTSKLHGYFVLKGQPYYGELVNSHDSYALTEQRFLDALNHEESLDYHSAEETYLTFYAEMKQKTIKMAWCCLNTIFVVCSSDMAALIKLDFIVHKWISVFSMLKIPYFLAIAAYTSLPIIWSS